MAKKPSKKKSKATKPNNYTVKIEPISPVAFAVPGIRKAAPGDTITFVNNTGGTVRLSAAGSNVLKGIKRLQPVQINKGKKKTFTVLPKSGTHELSIHYNYTDENKRRRTGFAIGASSPKIVIVPPVTVVKS
jgi:plastocyanin